MGVDLYELPARFLPLACPYCGNVENLDLAVEGNWDCGQCDGVFWITLARVVTLDEPQFARAVFELPDEDRGELVSLTNE